MRNTKSILRPAILAELARQGRSVYWLAGEMGMHKQSVYRMLADGADMKASNAEAMMSILGLGVVRKMK